MLGLKGRIEDIFISWRSVDLQCIVGCTAGMKEGIDNDELHLSTGGEAIEM